MGKDIKIFFRKKYDVRAGLRKCVAWDNPPDIF